MLEPMEFLYEDTNPKSLEEIWKEHPELAGKPEIWKPITQYAVKDVVENTYFVSTYGRVYSTLRNRFMRAVETDNGYFRVCLVNAKNGNRRYHLLHRIVMMTFYPIPNPNEFQVNHMDGVKSHNWYWNLEWATCSENRVHAIGMGLVKIYGEENPVHVISDVDADRIGYLLSTTDYTAKEIAKIIGNGATESNVFNILNGSSRHDVYLKYNLENQRRNPRVLNEYQIRNICKKFEESKSAGIKAGFGQRIGLFTSILNDLGIPVNDSTLRSTERLYYKLTHKDICNEYDY